MPDWQYLRTSYQLEHPPPSGVIAVGFMGYQTNYLVTLRVNRNHRMPNGEDRNWVRLCIAVNGFRARYQKWSETARSPLAVMARNTSSEPRPRSRRDRSSRWWPALCSCAHRNHQLQNIGRLMPQNKQRNTRGPLARNTTPTIGPWPGSGSHRVVGKRV